MSHVIKDMMGKFQAEQGLSDLKDHQLFETFATYCIVGQFYLDDYEPDSLRVGGPGDCGIDSAAVVINGNMFTDAEAVKKHVALSKDLRVHFVVVQAKYSPSFDGSVFTLLGANLCEIFSSNQPAIAMSEQVKNFKQCIDAVYAHPKKLTAEKPQLTITYATYGEPDSTSLQPKQDLAVRALEKLNLFGSVKMRAIGEKGLAETYKRAAEAVSATLTIDRMVKLPDMPGVNEAYIGVIPARDLVAKVLTDPLGDIRSVLFNENIRAFQGYDSDATGKPVGVNAEINKTLNNDDERSGFAVLNNGLSIVTRMLSTLGKQFTMQDFQIVNGCQTCYVLFDNADKLAKDVYVPVRIISSTDDALITRVVASTNRQNNVAVDGLSILDKFHKDIETDFKARPDPRTLYYERRPKQYAGEKIEKTRIISRQQLTKAYAAMFLDEAHQVSRLAELVVARRNELFQPHHDVLEYYTCAAAYYRIDWLLRNDRIPSLYSPARYHLIAGFKTYLIGPGLH
jgi:hypothetical protein